MGDKINLPEFADEDEERGFWANVDLSDHFTADNFAQVSFPHLKPTPVAYVPHGEKSEERP